MERSGARAGGVRLGFVLVVWAAGAWALSLGVFAAPAEAVVREGASARAAEPDASQGKTAGAESLFRSWERVEVPGGRCGDGSTYALFVSRGADDDKLAVTFMGGGACWNLQNCWGPRPSAWIHGYPFFLEKRGMFSKSPDDSPIARATVVHFPYCTGDVHLGEHVASYGLGVDVYHYGRRNVELGLLLAVERGWIRPDRVRELTVYGYSAGALGALSHVARVDALVPSAPLRTFIADAPGLHFGPDFWKKFPDRLVEDYRAALAEAGLSLDPRSGHMAHVIGELCRRLPRWQIGVLQGSRDVIMSAGFGNLSPDEHERLVFGPGGLWELTRDPTDNCSAWIAATGVHTFLVDDVTAGIGAGGISAISYAFLKQYRATSGRNYR